MLTFVLLYFTYKKCLTKTKTTRQHLKLKKDYSKLSPKRQVHNQVILAFIIITFSLVHYR